MQAAERSVRRRAQILQLGQRRRRGEGEIARARVDERPERARGQTGVGRQCVGDRFEGGLRGRRAAGEGGLDAIAEEGGARAAEVFV